MLKTFYVNLASRIVWTSLHISAAANNALWDDLEMLYLLCAVHVYRKFSEGVIGFKSMLGEKNNLFLEHFN